MICPFFYSCKQNVKQKFADPTCALIVARGIGLLAYWGARAELPNPARTELRLSFAPRANRGAFPSEVLNRGIAGAGKPSPALPLGTSALRVSLA